MTKRVRDGGSVVISGRVYKVRRAPAKGENGYTISVQDDEGNEFEAWADTWRGGRGPWKIRYDVTPSCGDVFEDLGVERPPSIHSK